MRRTAFRALGLIGFGLGPAILLAGCGAEETGARTTLNSIQPSSYVVRPPVTTTTTPSVDEGPQTDDEGRSVQPQEYTVQAGDFPVRIANLYGISLDELANFNGWTAPNYSEFPNIGGTVRIPPGANVIGGAPAADTGGDAPAGDASPDATPGTVETTPLPGSDGECVEGTHTIVSGDFPVRVADQYDITLEELQAANAGNPAMTQFIVGQELRIPCPD
jgi:LysM repeat protein